MPNVSHFNALFVAILFTLIFGNSTVAQSVEETAQELAEASEPAENGVEQTSPAPSSVSAGQEALHAALSALDVAGGMTVDQAGEAAVTSAPAIRRLESNVSAAEAQARGARLAFYPRLDLGVRYTRLSPIDQPSFGTGFTPEQLEMSQQAVAQVSDPFARGLWTGLLDSFATPVTFPVILNQLAFTGSLTIPVSDLFLTIMPGYEAANAAVDAQFSQIEVERRSIAHQARVAYFELARALAGETVAEVHVSQLTRTRAHLETLVNGGVAPRVDLLNLDASIAQARAAQHQARVGVRIARQGLATMLHRPATEIRLNASIEEVPQVPAETMEALIEQGLDQRPELAAMEAVKTARETAIRSELGRRFPQLLVQANAEISNPNNRIIPQQTEFRGTWDLSIILRWSPNDFGAARQRVEQMRAEIEGVEADRQAIEDGIRFEVTRAYAELEALHQVLAAANAALEAAEAAREIRDRQLQGGVAVTRDLLDADDAVVRARLSVIDATIQIHLANERLRQATGQ